MPKKINEQQNLTQEDLIKLYDSCGSRMREIGHVAACNELINVYGRGILEEIEKAKVREYEANLPEKYRDCLFCERPNDINAEICQIEMLSQYYDDFVIYDSRKKAAILWDPKEKKENTYHYCQEKYGREIADAMLEAKKENKGKLSDEMYRKLMNLPSQNEGQANVQKAALPEPDKKSNYNAVPALVKQAAHKDDRYFLQTKRGVIRNAGYRELFKQKGYSVVYEYAWANIVRDGWKDTEEYPIKAKYHDKGLLVYCSSLRHIADECGLDKNHIKKILDEFHKSGVVRVEKHVPAGKKQEQVVIVLGEWKMVEEGGKPKRQEWYYRDKVFYPEQ